MSLSSDLDALRLASLAKAALSAGIPPCSCGGTSWIAGAGGLLACAGCGHPAVVAGIASPRDTPTPLDGAGMLGGEGDPSVRETSGEVGTAGLGRAGVLASGGEPRSANPALLPLTDPDGSGGGPGFSSVTGVSRGTVVEEAPVAMVAEVGVLRGRVQRQRKGTAEFYEDAKSAHRRGMRRIRKFIAECEAQEAADRLLSRVELLARPQEEGGKYRYEALRDPHYKWALQEAGKFAHSQAPKEVKAETRLLIEFDMVV